MIIVSRTEIYKGMKIIIQLILGMWLIAIPSQFVAQGTNSEEQVDYMSLSIQLVQTQKDKGDVKDIVDLLAASSLEGIAAQVNTDNKKLAFWINIYNGFILHILSESPELYEDRRSFFKEPYIQIAGETLSFANIEHGILRRGQKDWGLGILPTFFPPNYAKVLRPDDRDYKIHFGLNCGAKSCPPVGIYRSETIEEQLCMMKEVFLKKFTDFDKESNTVTTTPLFSWFRGDFGGKRGVKKILLEQELIPSTNVSLKFGPYDWTLDIDNFAH